jgi:predicted RNase H-like HicB family nuclease
MAIHDEVLRTAVRVCRERPGWTFSPEEVVRALPGLNPSSVRTHIVSRCCVNAPKNHPHKWNYFRRLSRGVYEILPAHRRESRVSKKKPALMPSGVSEERAPYRESRSLRDSLHATLSRGEQLYVAECWELAVVTQGRTLDEVVASLEDALTLHLEGEERERLGFAPATRLIVTYELPLTHASPS